MVRGPQHDSVLSEDAFVPLLGADGPDLRVALHAIVTWSTSTSTRERLMQDSRFPLPGDLSAFLLVNQLIYRGAIRPTDVADAIDTGRSNVSKIVRRLEDAGLVARAHHPADDRGVVIVLTESGRRVGERISEAIDRANEPAADDWTAEELRMLETLVVKLARSLNALPGSPLTRAAGVDDFG